MNDARYQDPEVLRRRVEDFRVSIDPSLTTPPIDIFYIAEIELGLHVVSFPDLSRIYKKDAALFVDFSGIYIDQEAYLGWENADHWVEKRLRFSVAHELGHFILHDDLIEDSEYGSMDDFKIWIMSSENQKNADWQANEFAGRLLVPLQILEQHYDYYRATLAKTHPNWRQESAIRTLMTKKIAPRFGVTHQVISIRLDREGIWPAE